MIKLSKAKEILNLNLTEAGRKMPPDTYSALILAVETFNFIQLTRDTEGALAIPLLPGEEAE